MKKTSMANPVKSIETGATAQVAPELLKALVILSDITVRRSTVFFLTGIHSMQGQTATTRHGVTRKEAQKRLQDTENLFRKNLQLKDVC